MRVYLHYNNSQLNQNWTCNDVKFVPGFVVMEYAISEYGPKDVNPPKMTAISTTDIVFVRVYDE